MAKEQMIIQCKMNGHLTELPCTASGCPLFGDCYARYKEYTKNHQADTKGDQMMKPKITIYLKCGILMFMVAAGFLLTYTYAWFWLALPETWWAAALLAVLSGLSTLGLILWIGKEDHVPVRCGQCRHWTRHEPGHEWGTCFRRGFMHGVEKRENGYCDRGEPL